MFSIYHQYLTCNVFPNLQIKAAVIYLIIAQEDSLKDLKLALQLLEKNFLQFYPQYPIYLLYDIRETEAWNTNHLLDSNNNSSIEPMQISSLLS